MSTRAIDRADVRTLVGSLYLGSLTEFHMQRVTEARACRCETCAWVPADARVDVDLSSGNRLRHASPASFRRM